MRFAPSRIMQIQIRHDDTINGRAEVQSEIRALVTDALARFVAHITTIEVHVADENHQKRGGDDIRCSIEVRWGGRHPTAVTHHAADLYVAVDAAAAKMARRLDHELGRIRVGE